MNGTRLSLKKVEIRIGRIWLGFPSLRESRSEKSCTAEFGMIDQLRVEKSQEEQGAYF